MYAGVWVRVPSDVPCICHQVSVLILQCIVLCSLYLGICICKWLHFWLVWDPYPWEPWVIAWLCLCLWNALYALFVECPFKLFSQALDVWYNYGNVFVLLVAVIVPVVVGLSFCLIVDLVEIVVAASLGPSWGTGKPKVLSLCGLVPWLASLVCWIQLWPCGLECCIHCSWLLWSGCCPSVSTGLYVLVSYKPMWEWCC